MYLIFRPMRHTSCVWQSLQGAGIVQFLSLEVIKLWIFCGLSEAFQFIFLQGTAWELFLSSVEFRGIWKRAFSLLLLLMIYYFM